MQQTIDAEARIAGAEGRAAIYHLLARAFAYPEPEVIAGIVEEDLPAASSAAEDLGEDVAAPLAAFAHRIAHLATEEVARAFERVFTHIASPDWPPYETSYTSKGIFQQANDLADIAGFYAAYGVEVSRDVPERPDHISAELEFMYLLCFKESYALCHHGVEKADGCLADQQRFVEQHLGRWAAEFARRLGSGASGSPYADLAEALGAFIDEEKGRLTAAPEPITGPVEVVEPEADGCWAECVFRNEEAQADA